MTPEQDYRKQVRTRMALLTGLIAMREELDRDIAELTGANGVAKEEPDVARTTESIRAVLEAPQPVLLVAPEPVSNRRSLAMKERWKKRKALVAEPTPKRGRPIKEARIGFGTNAEFLYEYAMAHGNVIDTTTAKTDLAAVKHDLAVGSRLSVALAGMKGKGLLINDGKHRYCLTKDAVKVYTKERKK